MILRQALDRTLRLIRDEVHETASDETILAALTGTEVALVADAVNLASHSAQTTYVTAALLMARSGHRVHLLAPDIPLAGAQPPLPPGNIMTSLLKVGSDLLPGFHFFNSVPTEKVDLVITLGDAKSPISGRQEIALNAGDWEGDLVSSGIVTGWRGGDWPMGGMTAAGLAATEAFKITMVKLLGHARNPELMAELFAPSTEIKFRLAPEGTPTSSALGEFDCVSGGAITQAAIYALARLPRVQGYTRVIEPDFADLSNLNRYMLLLRSHLGAQKAKDLEDIAAATGLVVEPIAKRYDPEHAGSIALRDWVLVGVDDIPSRWLVQRANPKWLGIGATTHWSAMSSFHKRDFNGCAECLHPLDDPTNAPIPTVAFVSFWAGMLTASYFLRQRSGELDTAGLDQQIYITPIRPENPVWAIVPPRVGCETCKHLRFTSAMFEAVE